MRPELALLPLASLTAPQLQFAVFYESSSTFSIEKSGHLYTGWHWNSTSGKQPGAKGLPLSDCQRVFKDHPHAHPTPTQSLCHPAMTVVWSSRLPLILWHCIIIHLPDLTSGRKLPERSIHVDSYPHSAHVNFCSHLTCCHKTRSRSR